MTIDQQAVRTYLATNARLIDLALYDFQFGNSSQQAVIQALAAYQNKDGGFGKGIEPDFQLPDSSALATTVAFQYLAKLRSPEVIDMAHKGIAYFLQTYDRQKNGWNIVPKEVNSYPHAPWWEYEHSQQGFGWGNPAAEILGYLLQYREFVDDVVLVDTVAQRALERLRELSGQAEPDFHELLCYIRLHQQADQQLQAEIHQPLANLITKAANRNPDEWGSYVATPLTFIKAPGSPFISLFDHKLIKINLNYLKQAIVNSDHWGPTWDWGDSYPDDWQEAKRAWSGKLTVENVTVLRAFKAL